MIEFDGNAVDMFSIGFGALAILVKAAARKINGSDSCFNTRESINDLLNGASLVPFGLMIGSVFSSQLMQELMTSAKLSLGLGLAGGIGIFFILGELFKTK